MPTKGKGIVAHGSKLYSGTFRETLPTQQLSERQLAGKEGQANATPCLQTTGQ